MDIIIPYIHSDYGELRYALRSICKYQPHEKVVIVGDLPGWCNCENIKSDFVLNRPEFDVSKKILTGIPHVSDDFILWQDDIYKLDNTPLEPCFSDHLESAVKKRTEGRFKGIMQNTLAEFPNGLYYGGHTPMMINGKKFQQAVGEHWKKDLIPKTMYGNYANVGGKQVADCKIKGVNSYKTIKEHIAGRNYFSSGHHSMNQDMVKVLEELFPEKCKYEN